MPKRHNTKHIIHVGARTMENHRSIQINCHIGNGYTLNPYSGWEFPVNGHDTFFRITIIIFIIMNILVGWCIKISCEIRTGLEIRPI